MKPEEGTPEHDLWLCAIDIAVAAPWKQATQAGDTKIPWDDIHRLRQTLDAMGIDWQSVKHNNDEALAKLRHERPTHIAVRMQRNL